MSWRSVSWGNVSARHAESGRKDFRSPARPDPDPARIRDRLARCPEIDCLRHLLPPARLAAAELRAGETATGADRVLVTEGELTDDDYVRAFAFHHNLEVETFERVPRAACPLGDDELIEALASGVVPIRSGGDLIWVVAPWQRSARFLVEQLRRHPEMRRRVRIATLQSLRDFAHRQAESAVARKAAFELRATRPTLSAGTERSRMPLGWLTAGLALTVAVSATQFHWTAALTIAFALVFLGWSGLRAAAIVLSSVDPPPRPRKGDDALPVYSILVAVYNEAQSVHALVEALSRLDYPKERLDIKIVVERDDLLTRLALDLMGLKAPFEVVIAPAFGPQTKPKALNAALPFARGRYVTVYDAEDRPEPMQLRTALAAFEAADPKLACVQARLTIDNTADSWLTRGIMAQTPQALS